MTTDKKEKDTPPQGSPCCRANIEPHRCDGCRGKGHLRINGSRLACKSCLGKQFIARCANCQGVIDSVTA